MTTKNIGNHGEAIAASYLEKKGVRLIGRNFQKLYGEIDIIGVEGSRVVFYEVKYRTNGTCGDGIEAITEKKLSRLRKAISIWLQENPYFIRFPKVINALIVDEHGNVEEYEIA